MWEEQNYNASLLLKAKGHSAEVWIIYYVECIILLSKLSPNQILPITFKFEQNLPLPAVLIQPGTLGLDLRR